MANTRIISRRKVAEACQRLLNARAKYIKDRREELIDVQMAPRWWRKAQTREEAIQFLKDTDWNSAWWKAEYKDSKFDAKVKRLLVLAQLGDDYVDSNNDQYEYMTIDDESAAILEDWWN